MTPDQEQRMRNECREFSHMELIDLAVRLQKTIDSHMDQKTANNDMVDAMKAQNQALRERNEELEAIAGGGAPAADPEELALKDEEIARLKTRLERLQELNEKLQEKLVA